MLSKRDNTYLVLSAVESLPENYSGLGLLVDGLTDEEIYNTVKELDEKSLIKVAYLYADSGHDFNIYGLKPAGQTLLCEYRTNPFIRLIRNKWKTFIAFVISNFELLQKLFQRFFLE